MEVAHHLHAQRKAGQGMQNETKDQNQTTALSSKVHAKVKIKI
jgi:hypothetical protein